ncbi:mucin-15 [Sorex fumeus]|uniref:mucin-15 n=1 Tax=Sorex fumeus TaxID=62283 RepID=UPI0024ADBCD7|nr:mucin-15 [Sorex fumeus]
MLILPKILLISTLFSLLLFGSNGNEGVDVTTAKNSTKGSRITENASHPLNVEENSYSFDDNKESSKANDTPAFDSSNKIQTTTDVLSNLPTGHSGTLKPRTTVPTSPPFIGDFVSKLPQNSFGTSENSLPVSVPPNATSALPSENFTSMPTATMSSENISIMVSIFTPVLNTTSATTIIKKPEDWLTTTSENIPYEETTTYPDTTSQHTSKFTNNSKNFPNTSDPQKENRNTGVVFGAILGAILGASFLSLVGYLLCGKRKTDSFSHRRLYDDRNEPVLRLDNAPEPYDMSFGNSSYYNPSVNDPYIPTGQENARDGIPMGDIPPLRTSEQN